MSTAAERYLSRLNLKFAHKVDGAYYHGTEEYIRNDVRNMEIKADDIALITYPKCGTHWVQKILCYLRDDSDLDKVKEYRFAPLDVVHPNMTVKPIGLVEEMPSPRIVVTHFPFELCPLGIQEGKCKVIYVARNPKDAAVSMFHFEKKIKVTGNFEDFPWSDYIEVYSDMKDNLITAGSWFRHVKNWLQHRNDGNVLFITFEELKRDSPKCITKMANFLGKNIDLERANGIADLCDFKKMKEQAELKEKEHGGKFNFSALTRKGEVGDWKNYFTVSQDEAFNKLYQSEMGNVDLNVEFEI